jgi:hypothetical protein
MRGGTAGSSWRSKPQYTGVRNLSEWQKVIPNRHLLDLLPILLVLGGEDVQACLQSGGGENESVIDPIAMPWTMRSFGGLAGLAFGGDGKFMRGGSRPHKNQRPLGEWGVNEQSGAGHREAEVDVVKEEKRREGPEHLEGEKEWPDLE